jgi:hypothetical protein
MKALYNFLTARGQMIALFLAILCVAIVMGSIFSGLGSAGYDTSTDLVSILKDPDSTQEFNFFNPAVAIPRILILLCVIAVVVFGVLSVVSDPKGSLKFIISGGVIVLLFFVFYASSESETTGKIFALLQREDISEGTSKFISGGIKTTMLLIGFSIVSAVAGEVYNIFK